jgi:hypothetical protein
METKIIPFCLETAKKIQAGEIKGRVMSNNAEARIIDLDMYFQGKKCICVQILGNSGKYITNLYNTDGTDADFIVGYGLYIELQYPDDEPQFKPFDRVLVRHYDVSLWQPAFFWKFFDELSKTPYYTIGGNKWEQCIPYDGNEHLVGTIDKPKED